MKRFIIRHGSILGLLAFAWLASGLIDGVGRDAEAGAPVGTYWNSNCPAGSATLLTCGLFRGAFNLIQQATVTLADIADHLITGVKLDLSDPPTSTYSFGYDSLAELAAGVGCFGASGSSSSCLAMTPNNGDLYAVGTGTFGNGLAVTGAVDATGDVSGANADFTGDVDADGDGTFDTLYAAAVSDSGQFYAARKATFGDYISAQDTANSVRSVCAGYTREQCKDRDAVTSGSFYASANARIIGAVVADDYISSGSYVAATGGVSAGAGSFNRKWKTAQSTLDGTNPTTVATGGTLAFASCMAAVMPGGTAYYPPNDGGASYSYYWGTNGTVVMQADGAAYSGAPYRCVLEYE